MMLSVDRDREGSLDHSPQAGDNTEIPLGNRPLRVVLGLVVVVVVTIVMDDLVEVAVDVVVEVEVVAIAVVDVADAALTSQLQS